MNVFQIAKMIQWIQTIHLRTANKVEVAVVVEEKEEKIVIVGIWIGMGGKYVAREREANICTEKFHYHSVQNEDPVTQNLKIWRIKHIKIKRYSIWNHIQLFASSRQQETADKI